MALYSTGILVLKAVKPVLASPFFIIPSSVNVQVRHAARKGYREKVKKQKKLADIRGPKDRDFSKLKKKFTKIEKTLNLKKPEPPSDDVIIMTDFNYKKFSLSEAVRLHREYHHPTVFNNPKAPVTLRIELNLTAKKANQFIKPFSGIAAIPHHFSLSHKKEVLVFCSSQDKEMALSCGASVAGNVEIIEKIKEGVIQPSLYEYILAHVSVLPELASIRNKLKDQYPKVKNGTLTNDLKTSITRFLHGLEYSCLRFGTAEDFGCINCSIGTINMELNHLEENLKALIEDIEKHKPNREGEFISWIWCLSPPSSEEFSLDLSQYLEIHKKRDIDDDDEEMEVKSEKSEKDIVKDLIRDYKEEELMKTKI